MARPVGKTAVVGQDQVRVFQLFSHDLSENTIQHAQYRLPLPDDRPWDFILVMMVNLVLHQAAMKEDFMYAYPQ